MPTSIHTDGISEIHEVPLKEILRPLQSQVDEEKVQSIMKTLQVINNNYSYDSRAIYNLRIFLKILHHLTC